MSEVVEAVIVAEPAPKFKRNQLVVVDGGKRPTGRVLRWAPDNTTRNSNGHLYEIDLDGWPKKIRWVREYSLQPVLDIE